MDKQAWGTIWSDSSVNYCYSFFFCYLLFVTGKVVGIMGLDEKLAMLRAVIAMNPGGNSKHSRAVAAYLDGKTEVVVGSPVSTSILKKVIEDFRAS